MAAASDTGSMPEVFIYADGACSGNPGPGGWGALLKCPGQDLVKHMSGAEPNTTNNRMELTAVIEAFKALKTPCSVTVVTDSRYVVDAFKAGWIRNWLRNGWKTAGKQPVKNVELWQELLAVSQNHRVTWEWIRGHAGHPENEIADALAVKARKEL